MRVVSRIDLESYEDEWEEDEVLPQRRRAPGGSKDAEGAPLGRVIGLHKGWVDVLVDGQEVEAVYAGAMRGESVVVGDRVRLRAPRSASDTYRVVARLDRGTELVRTADDKITEERVLVANVDLAVVVLGPTDDPEVGTRFVDRVLVAAEAGGLQGAVCMNKIDLLDGGGGDTEILDRYADLGYTVLRTSAITGDGVDELKALLSGRWSVLAGHSGVGKTSLTNRLVPESRREVGELGRFGGRHTTVSPRAMPVPGADDAWIVDTPGVRSFGIAHLPAEDLAWAFPELRGADCELPGCLHDGEPGCAVPELLGSSLHPDRLESYRRFLAALLELPDGY